MLLCQPPVGPVFALLPLLVSGSTHANPIQSTVPQPPLFSTMTFGPPGAGLGQGKGGYPTRDPDSRGLRAPGLHHHWRGLCLGPDKPLPTRAAAVAPLHLCHTRELPPPPLLPWQGQRPEEAGFRRNPGSSPSQTCTPVPRAGAWGGTGAVSSPSLSQQGAGQTWGQVQPDAAVARGQTPGKGEFSGAWTERGMGPCPRHPAAPRHAPSTLSDPKIPPSPRMVQVLSPAPSRAQVLLKAAVRVCQPPVGRSGGLAGGWPIGGQEKGCPHFIVQGGGGGGVS